MRWAALIAGIFTALVCACPNAVALSFGLPPDITAPKTAGYEIPLYGEREQINRLYRAPDGHLVLAFQYGPLHGLKSDLYDTVSGQRAYPELERKAATDNAVEQGYVQSHGLKMLYGGGPTPAGKEVHSSYDGGRICPNNPYMSDVQIGSNWDDRFFLFQKLPRPSHVTLDPECGVAPVTYRYKDRTAIFYANDHGFFMKIDRFLIWFDWNAHSDFLSGRDDFVVVPAAVLEPVLENDHEDGEAFTPAAIRKADRVIAQYGARQLKAKKHV